MLDHVAEMSSASVLCLHASEVSLLFYAFFLFDFFLMNMQYCFVQGLQALLCL